MAGRGRGRGKGRGFTFDISQIGFQKGEALPAGIQQPPPLFPPLQFKPVPLTNTEAGEYMLALKQEFRGIMQESGYFIKPDVVKKDIQRYSDKYKEQKLNNISKWEPDWSKLPAELKEKPKRKTTIAKPSLLSSGKRSKASKLPDVTKRLDELEKKGDEEEDEDDEGEEGNEKEGEEELEYDEEEQEEDNDYLVSHYDDGEEVGFQDDDDMDEGPTY